ncbi:MAG: hypothetical protein SGJ21_06170 [Alphaproteobacteria bacterium]|nr:hypothetical protein [Alphaproteobacteria bacterium]
MLDAAKAVGQMAVETVTRPIDQIKQSVATLKLAITVLLVVQALTLVGVVALLVLVSTRAS